eukprot:CAMPEP_0178435036 /NCGR_PEP_ID=MMETSP0689_2-20121128/33724_1 /TAXON_ID=160604 /ORGANISM="Amphidinium massartii, Strain CS-259" /LENGTH=612 /DNA_ID=CAMNT_0020057103 /DNA_START=56 /DNA_END=1890 /DNA_ORIENTATION=-
MAAEGDVNTFSQARHRARVDAHYRGVWTSLQRASQRLRGVRPRALEVRCAINEEHARRLARELALMPEAEKVRPGSPPRVARHAGSRPGTADGVRKHARFRAAPEEEEIPLPGDAWNISVRKVGASAAEEELPAYLEELLEEYDRPLETYAQDLYAPSSTRNIGRSSLAGALLASICNETDSSKLPGLALLGLGLGLTPDMLQGAAIGNVEIPVPPAKDLTPSQTAATSEAQDGAESEPEQDQHQVQANQRPKFWVKSGCSMPGVRSDLTPGLAPAALWGPPAEPSRQAVGSGSAHLAPPPSTQVHKAVQPRRPDTATSQLLYPKAPLTTTPRARHKKILQVRGNILTWKAAQRAAKTAGTSPKAAASPRSPKKQAELSGGGSVRLAAGDSDRRRNSVSVLAWGGDAFANEGYGPYGDGPATSFHRENTERFRSQVFKRLRGQVTQNDFDSFGEDDEELDITMLAQQLEQRQHTPNLPPSAASSALPSPYHSTTRLGGVAPTLSWTGRGGEVGEDQPGSAQPSLMKAKKSLISATAAAAVVLPGVSQGKSKALPPWLHAAHLALEGEKGGTGTHSESPTRLSSSRGFCSSFVVPLHRPHASSPSAAAAADFP